MADDPIIRIEFSNTLIFAEFYQYERLLPNISEHEGAGVL